METHLVVDRHEDGVVVLTLNRPDSLNAINTELGLGLQASLRELAKDKQVRVLVITGRGRAFCAGGDLKERQHMTYEQWTHQHRLFQDVYRQMRRFPKPVVAAVNGIAVGGGFELVLSADFSYASPNAKFGFPEVMRGIIPGVGGTQLIGRFAPHGVALELLMTGRTISAQEAERRGLVNWVIDADALMATTLDTATMIAKNSPFAVRLAKKALLLGGAMSLEDGVDMAVELYNRTIVHPDREEGVNAYNERRQPYFLDSD